MKGLVRKILLIPYNWVIVKGVYESYLQKDILKIKSILHKQFNELFKVLMFVMIIIFGIGLIIAFAKNFNIKTIAEFVDSKEKFEKLKEMGIDYFQGYYFCKPVDIKIISSRFIYGDF